MYGAQSERQWKKITKPINGILIPNGDPVLLDEDFEVVVTQALGDTITVMTDKGFMARLDREKAAEQGLVERDVNVGVLNDPSLPLEERVQNALKSCFDPEIPVNIVDLGLVYKCEVEDLPEQPGKKRVVVDFTLTAPGCGMGGVLQEDLQRKIGALPEVAEVVCQVVFEPRWTQDRMTDAAKLQLNLL